MTIDLRHKFFIDKANPTPIQTQLKDQIKVMLLMGRLHEGDMLPSIRELEQQLDVGRSIVWDAYKDLEKAGILKLTRGRGAQVNREWEKATSQVRRASKCELLSQKFIKEIEKSGFVLSSFVRYLSNRVMQLETTYPPFGVVEDSYALAEDYALQIGQFWNVSILPIVLGDLIKDRRLLKRVRRLITSYYWLDAVEEMAEPAGIPVFPISANWSQQMLDTLNSLPDSSKVLFLFREEDYQRYGELFVDDLKGSLSRGRIRILLAPFEESGDLEKLASSGKYQRIYVGTRVWDLLDEKQKKIPTLDRPTLTVNQECLERMRIWGGMVV